MYPMIARFQMHIKHRNMIPEIYNHMVKISTLKEIIVYYVGCQIVRNTEISPYYQRFLNILY